MFDGVVRLLTNIRYRQDLKKNLISLGTLDSLGCIYLAKDGIMKITKGASVVMKGEKIGNLYILLGNIVIGGAIASTLVEPDSSEESALRWRLDVVFL